MGTSPNILLVISDDHAAWALHQNPLGVPTPNLDRLRAEGTRFSQAFTPCPVCSPARACLMTGEMPSAVGIHDWLDESDPEVAGRGWLEGVPTLPEMLQQEGYQAFLSGKWHLGHPGQTPPGFDHAFCMSPRMRTHLGTDTYFLDGVECTLEGNRSSLITDQALRFLDAVDPCRPFFLNVGYFATHSPYVESAHEPEGVAPFAQFDFPEMPRLPSHPEARNENGPHPHHDPEDERRARWRGYANGVAEIDAGLGRLLAHLEQTDHLDRTLILYTSDHGCCLGHHGIWGKGNGTRPVNFTDTSIRVPLLMRGPGITAGAEDPGLTTHLETHQRILHAAGVIRQEPVSPLPFILGEYGDSRMIRTPEWKWIEHRDGNRSRLYHLAEDPEETRDLGGDAPQHQAMRTSQSAQLQAAFAPFADSEVSGERILTLPVHNAHEPWAERRTPKEILS